MTRLFERLASTIALFLHTPPFPHAFAVSSFVQCLSAVASHPAVSSPQPPMGDFASASKTSFVYYQVPVSVCI